MDGQLVSTGGRVLGVTAIGADAKEAQTLAYTVRLCVRLCLLTCTNALHCFYAFMSAGATTMCQIVCLAHTLAIMHPCAHTCSSE
jgi:hypothetical protein